MLINGGVEPSVNYGNAGNLGGNAGNGGGNAGNLGGNAGNLGGNAGIRVGLQVIWVKMWGIGVGVRGI